MSLILNKPRTENEIKPLRFTLCMIVKNEAHIIKRCLDSVKDLIDYWVIVDTGSFDETVSVISEHLKDIPGNLLSREWVDFSVARNQALEAAFHTDCDYALIIDADEVVSEDLTRESLEFMVSAGRESDVYLIDVKCEHFTNPRVFLIKKGYPGRYHGAIHEDLDHDGTWKRFGNVKIISHNDGARYQNPNRVNDDLIILFKEIEKAPKNPRNYYYLGMTYWCANAYDMAEKAFQIRLKMGGNPTEMKIAMECLLALDERRKHGENSNKATA